MSGQLQPVTGGVTRSPVNALQEAPLAEHPGLQRLYESAAETIRAWQPFEGVTVAEIERRRGER